MKNGAVARECGPSHDGNMTDDSISPPREPDPDQVIASIQEHIGRVPLPEWPVFGLLDLDEQGWLCGAGESPGSVHVIRLDYRQPGARERLIVQTQPAGAGTLQLGRVLDRLERDEDDGEPFQLLDGPQHPAATSTEGQTHVLLDHQAVPATQQRRGASRAWLLRTDGVAIVVGARHVDLDSVALHQINDLESLKQRRAQVIEQLLRTHPNPLPPNGPRR